MSKPKLDEFVLNNSGQNLACYYNRAKEEEKRFYLKAVVWLPFPAKDLEAYDACKPIWDWIDAATIPDRLDRLDLKPRSLAYLSKEIGLLMPMLTRRIADMLPIDNAYHAVYKAIDAYYTPVLKVMPTRVFAFSLASRLSQGQVADRGSLCQVFFL